MLAFAGTAIVFFACSAYVLTTKKDMSFLSTAIFLIIYRVIVRDCGKLLLPNSSTSGGDQCIVCGILNHDILYETSNIIHGGETNYIRATVSIYVSILQLIHQLIKITFYLLKR